MWRSLFLALGIFSLILGAETLVVDKYIMADSRRLPRLINGSANRSRTPANPYYQQAGYQRFPNNQQNLQRPARIVQTKDWMPWSLLATGAIIVLYTYSLPNRGDSSSD